MHTLQTVSNAHKKIHTALKLQLNVTYFIVTLNRIKCTDLSNLSLFTVM